MDTALTRVREATLSVALVASVAVHVTTFVALVGLDGGPRTKFSAVREPAPTMLEARLISLVPEVPPAPEPPAIAPAIAALETASSTPQPSPPPALIPAAPSRTARASEQTPFGWSPRIVVNDRVPRARFGEAFEGDVLAGYPIEVDVAVGIPDKIAIPYPQAALAARREGAVLAWLAIDANGRVEAVHVIEGDADFAAAVESALAKTPFVPARDHGLALRYYVTLEFDFRIEATGASVAAGSVPAAAR